ncbi:MAG TPA: response regulator transcription factor [Anaerolineae bacterium]|mgnify:CR=1 FL=1|nr:response regulator transcription factor [Anaerolineae bacterium]MCB0181125.1 response regulator transcription factor [Anaerolineae bacterium]MCB0225519.1 response regulator transcription factor [Anaerolineae bacterium]MCB9108032.1 response regulator transcription factor [Anaerolineales bacterium]HRV92443.1 response regulator transcription factor [Anaerolineae bacterium]
MNKVSDTLKVIKVIIVDDHAMVRTGLTAFLKIFDDMELIGEASSGSEAIELCVELEPDVVLMDMVMPEMDGPTAIKAILKRFPHIHIIALTSFREQDLVQRALEAGATSYLLKDVSADELADAIRLAAAGRSTLAPEAAQVLLHAATHPRNVGLDLTDRERQVLPLLVKGLNNGEIARKMMISQSTVRFHVSNILSKLGAHSRTEAAALAIKYNLVS